MSMSVMSMVWRVDNQFLTSSEKSILLRLADCGSDDGSHVFPSIGTLEEDTGISGRWITKTLKSLQEKKVLVKVRDANAGGKYKSCFYKIMVGVLRGMERIKPEPEPQRVYSAHHDPRTQFTCTPELSSGVPLNSVHLTHELSSPNPLTNLNTLNTSLCTNCAERRDHPPGEEKKKRAKREPENESKTVKVERFKADRLEIDFAFKCIAVKHGMDRTWIASEFEEFKAWWVDAPQKNNPCKSFGHWRQAWNNWCSRINATLKEPQPDVTVKDEFIPSPASAEKLLSIAKDPDYPYYDKVIQAGGFDHCYNHGFPRPAPGDTSKRNMP